MIRKVANPIFINMSKYKVHIIWAVIAVVAFVGGMFYGKSAASPAGQAGTYASSMRGAGRYGGGFVSGQVLSVDSTTVIVGLASGNSEIVLYSTSTQIVKPTAVPANSLAPGMRVTIGGTPNSDGSLTAQTIQIQAGERPQGSQ